MSDDPQGEVCLVTGAAGFIGSHLCERLIQDGYHVIGVDCFAGNYARSLKERNLAALKPSPRFQCIEADLAKMDLGTLLDGVSFVFHQAAQPGVRSSWGAQFAAYLENNVLVTQRLLEAALRAGALRKFVYASSSSVYGNNPTLPLRETDVVWPISPYGVTKLSGEHLVRLYASSGQLPTVSLRYFTVYGPRQRPDMAFHKFLHAIYADQEIQVYGDGEQTRDFTFVTDIVRANLLAARLAAPGSCINIGGGARVTVNHCLQVLRDVTGREVRVQYGPPQPGDVRHTWADTTAARTCLGFVPQVSLEKGLVAEDAWFRDAYGIAEGR